MIAFSENQIDNSGGKLEKNSYFWLVTNDNASLLKCQTSGSSMISRFSGQKSSEHL